MLQACCTGALVSPGRGWDSRTAANSLSRHEGLGGAGSVAAELSLRRAAYGLGRGSCLCPGAQRLVSFAPPPPRSVSALALVDVLLKAVGDTPIMKTKKWTVERTRTIQGLVDFIKKFLKLVASEQLFIYVNQSFAPSPDQEVGTLYECFGSDGKLVLHYCKSQAWG
ncbi:ubiquitin-like protein ATG12 isoform X1 [Terrapene carolina triunguis]|uniref:ubiquitin-like protein ATG12 isoform X1 n=1 Tax=Terrapene triunguis TaxID=2587831 RepID=UPI000CEFA3C8|nr:ubiquitin-like protein ATG12 isoform X1 [Terrapene carolina triunguis]